MKKNTGIPLAGFAAITLLSVWCCLRHPRRDAVLITARVDGRVTASWLLSENTEADIDTTYGHNRIRIRNGYALMCEADCPDGYCMLQHAIGAQGSGMIVCLPHHLVITAETACPSPEEPEQPDTVAQ